MKKYKWNEEQIEVNIWEPNHNDGYGREYKETTTNKQILNNPFQCKYEDILMALCKAVSELIEIEENRND